MSISNLDTVKKSHFEKAWNRNSTLNIIKLQGQSSQKIENHTFFLKFLKSSEYYYIAINHRYFITALSFNHLDIIRSYDVVNIHRFFINYLLRPIRLTNLLITLNPFYLHNQQVKTIKVKLYIGPKKSSSLRYFGYHLEDNINFGVFSIIGKPMLWLLLNLSKYFKGIGLSIVVLTLLIKIITFPLTRKSITSIEKTKKIRPQLKFLQKKFGYDAALLYKKQMKLYAKNGINPLNGCLPLIIQMPIWLSLYQMLLNSVELYQESFFWISDLTEFDNCYILPCLMTITMFIQSFFQVATDGYQKYLSWSIPVFIGFVTIKYQLPSGLTLYICTNNILTIIQHIYIKNKCV